MGRRELVGEVLDWGLALPHPTWPRPTRNQGWHENGPGRRVCALVVLQEDPLLAEELGAKRGQRHEGSELRVSAMQHPLLLTSASSVP